MLAACLENPSKPLTLLESGSSIFSTRRLHIFSAGKMEWSSSASSFRVLMSLTRSSSAPPPSTARRSASLPSPRTAMRFWESFFRVPRTFRNRHFDDASSCEYPGKWANYSKILKAFLPLNVLGFNLDRECLEHFVDQQVKFSRRALRCSDCISLLSVSTHVSARRIATLG
eukprot:1767724-Pleurochrysis_carterae.AAC.4